MISIPMPRRKPNQQRRDTKGSGLGYEFRDELQAALARVRENPLLYAAESGSIRIAPLHRFPYSLIYEELTDRPWIAAVAHQSRRPGYWSRRRPT
jgi:toxin ParE1/3/4